MLVTGSAWICDAVIGVALPVCPGAKSGVCCARIWTVATCAAADDSAKFTSRVMSTWTWTLVTFCCW
jgi:hypothetical protein